MYDGCNDCLFFNYITKGLMSVKFTAEAKVSNDPKLMTAKSGISWIKVNFYTSRKDKKTDKWESDFYSAAFFGDKAKEIEARIRKGQKIKIEGAVSSKQVEVAGQKWKKNEYDFTGYEIQVLEEAKGETKEMFGAPRDAAVQKVAEKFDIKQEPAKPKEKPKYFNPFTGDPTDEIPF
jgi:single-stranded DNA-binding protein